ncbi:SusC/RagA family TonB-linked outer membrane protein [Fulvivirgaceae bacterium BMA10]|uniref:SusC/RagA family TonB-linked outer membrane protein n=1 Tax=Splendidivirga corallicola TaxID=3051826 RepID=A0ABT8KLF5_9BACT|nr:SusC/RagA family TonB-linked outer membrane protein [Fulvivirgaceae bacterium BMA10]
MKNKLLQQIAIMSKYAFVGLIIQISLGSLLIAADSGMAQGSVENVHLGIKVHKASLIEVFDIIEAKTDFEFAYRIQDIDKRKNISLEFPQESLGNILRHISKNSNLSFRRVNNQITVKKGKRGVSEVQDEVYNEYPEDIEISGKITDENGQELPGASVLEKGTTNGTTTDLFGNYKLSVPENATLIISFVGYQTQEIQVGTRSTIDVQMIVAAEQLKDVIVTAFGLEREKKAITYSAQTVDVNEFSEARSLNVVNSLSGKVAGLNFSTTSNGVGSPSRINLRGNRSLTGNNQPLYVIDGVPVDNSVSTSTSDVGRAVSSDGISNVNPEDIESISVLKGPSAAALYGTRANNGVIIIKTKSGKGSSGARISVSSNFMISKAYHLIDFQDEFGQGNGGVYDANSRNSWGPAMNGQSVSAWQLIPNPDYSGPATYSLIPQPNNSKDFFETGYNWAKSVAVTAGRDNIQGYFSYTNTTANGIVAGNDLDRHNMNVRLTSNISKKLELDVKTNFIVQEIDNPQQTGEVSTGIAAYTVPRSLPIDQYRDFEFVDPAGQAHQNYIDNAVVGGVGGNPFWFALRKDVRTDTRNRFIGFASLKYNFTDALSLQLRSGIDRYTNRSATKNYASASFNNNQGAYSESIGEVKELNSDFLLAYDKTFGELSLNISVGGNTLIQNKASLSSGGLLSRRNFFAMANVENFGVQSGFFDKQINSLYGFAQLGYKGYLFLDVTGRNDWSSALPSDNRSFFYPSIGISGVISDMFEDTPEALTFLKVRVSYAQVGNDTDPFQLNREFIYSGANGGILTSSPLLRNENLKPEISTSLEFGVDVRFFKNRLGIDFTWFKTNTEDQIFTINTPESSGFSQEVINGGDVENKGIELVLNATPIETSDFIWDISANYASYDSKIIEINGDREELVFGAGRLVQSKITKGGEYGDLYIRGFERLDDGQILIDANGIPEFTPGFDVLAGNFNPDWTAGLQNRFAYKNFSLSFLLDFRIGGEVISYTQARLAGIGASALTLPGREGFVVDGVVATRNADGDIISAETNITSITAENYWTSVAPRDPRSAEDFVYDATNVRLRELVLGYSLPSSLLDRLPFSSASISIVGRNLFFLVNKAEFFDPEQGVGIGNLQGVESFNLPATRNFGFNVKLGF